MRPLILRNRLPWNRTASQNLDWLNTRAPFFIIAAIVGLAIAIIVGEWRSGTIGGSRPVELTSLVFQKQPDGTLAVHSAIGDRQLIKTYPSSEEGFVATMIKSLNFERRRYGVTESEPFRLARSQTGHVTLVDPVIGTEIELAAFGQTNHAAFLDLMAAGRPRQ